MLKLASEIESVRITFRFSMLSNSFIPMKHILTVSRRMITDADIESSAQPLASLWKREILPFHHQIDIISSPPACKAMTSVGGSPEMQTRMGIIMTDTKGIMIPQTHSQFISNLQDADSSKFRERI